MYFEQISTPGLGCFSYAVGCPQAGVMAVVDPRRDIGVYLRIAKEQGMRITHIFETHVHADHISGARDLRAAAGADIYIHESAPVRYDAKKLRNGDEFRFGDAILRVLHTPGHTPNSISILIADLARSTTPELILTGDLLFVGDIGRPDLPGEEIMSEQTESLYNSLYTTLVSLPDYLEIYPAHGQGSLCGQGMSAKSSSTLGYERVANPMLKYANFKDFKNAILSRLPMRPQSFSGIIAANLDGPPLLTGNSDAEYALSAGQADEILKSGALPLDLRDSGSFGAAHIPGSINVDATNSAMLNWIGMAVSPDIPLILILPAGRGFEEMFTELQRIGYDKDVKGWLKGGLQAWRDSGRKTAGLPHLSAADLEKRLTGSTRLVLIDVRTPEEFSKRKIEGSVNLTFNQLVKESACPVENGAEIVVICQSGFRAGIAASMLLALGCGDVSLLAGGINAWPEK